MKDIINKIESIKSSIKNIEDKVIGVEELTKQVGSLPIYSIEQCQLNSVKNEGLYKVDDGTTIILISKEVGSNVEYTQYKFGDSILKRVGSAPKNSNLTPKYSKEWESVVDLKKIEDQVNQIGTSVNKEMEDFKTAIVEALGTEIDNIYSDIDSLQDVINSLSSSVNSLSSNVNLLNNYLNSALGQLKYTNKSPWSASVQLTTFINIYRDYYYRFKNSGSSMYIYLYDRNDGYENITTDTYEFEFHVNSSYSKPSVYIYNTTVKWANNTPPPYTPGKIYQINIQNGLGVWVEFNQ